MPPTPLTWKATLVVRSEETGRTIATVVVRWRVSHVGTFTRWGGESSNVPTCEPATCKRLCAAQAPSLLRALEMLVEAADNDIYTDAPECQPAVQAVLDAIAEARRILTEATQTKRGQV